MSFRVSSVIYLVSIFASICLFIQCRQTTATRQDIKELSWLLGQYNHTQSSLKSNFVQVNKDCIEWVTFYLEDGQPVTIERARFIQSNQNLLFTSTNFFKEKNEVNQYNVTFLDDHKIELTNISDDDLKKIVLVNTSEQSISVHKKFSKNKADENLTLERTEKP